MTKPIPIPTTCLAIFVGTLLPFTLSAQSKLEQALFEAMNSDDVVAVERLVKEAKRSLGDKAGRPEVPDEFMPVPTEVKKPGPDELRRGFDPILRKMRRGMPWEIGEDPGKVNHKLRTPASVLTGCLAASEAGCDGADELLKLARECGDYLLWTQEQAGAGLFPFPARRGGEGKVFQIADRALAKAEREGKLEEVLHNGWFIEDFDMDDGGLQFDNGVSGVAVLHLYEVTKDEAYLTGAKKAADWAASRSLVPNWNYNSFSVYLLAEVYRVTGEKRYFEAAKKKALLGVIPGQLDSGPMKGRWIDPHNAMPAYHYIMLRALACLAGVMEPDDPDRDKVLSALRIGFETRNRDLVEKGVFNTSSTLEALLLLERRLPGHRELLGPVHHEEALEKLITFLIANARNDRIRTDPGSWGMLLERLIKEKTTVTTPVTSISVLR